MIVYQCDKCKKLYDNINSLLRVSFVKKMYNSAIGANAYYTVHEDDKPPYYEICKTCASEIEDIFCNYFKE